MKKTLTFILSAAALVCMSSVAFGQVATPSIDPSLPTYTGSASSWRFGSTLAAQSFIGKEKTPTQSTPDKTKTKGAGGLLAWQPTQVTLEMSGVAGLVDPVWDASSDAVVEHLITEQKASISVRGKNRVSVGIDVREKATAVEDVTRSESAFGGSFGIRIGEGIYLGGGQEKVVEKVEGYQDKKWTNVYSGIGLRYGWPNASMFRMEYSMINRGGDDRGDGYFNVVPKMDRSIGSIETQFWGLLFSYQYSKETEAALTGELGDRVQELARYGGGLRTDYFTVILYRADGKETIDAKEHLSKDWRLTVGFHFI